LFVIREFAILAKKIALKGLQFWSIKITLKGLQFWSIINYMKVYNFCPKKYTWFIILIV